MNTSTFISAIVLALASFAAAAPIADGETGSGTPVSFSPTWMDILPVTTRYLTKNPYFLLILKNTFVLTCPQDCVGGCGVN